MLPSLALVTVLAAVPGISLRVIEEGSPPGPPSTWVLGEEVVSAWEVADVRFCDPDCVYFRLLPTARAWLRDLPRSRRLAVVVTAPDGNSTPLFQAGLLSDPDLDERTVRVSLGELFNEVDLVFLAAESVLEPWLTEPRFVAAMDHVRARGQLMRHADLAAWAAWGPLVRDPTMGRYAPPGPRTEPPYRQVLLRWRAPALVPRDDILRWWTDGPEPLRPFAIAVLAAYHAPSCLDLLRDEALHAPDAERRGRARLALAAAGDREQAAYLRARLVNDAPAEVGVVDAALALAALGDVGALDGVRAVAADWQSRDERMLLAVRALEQALAVRALARD